MATTADIVIAGAGVIGLSTALQLTRRTTARIVVLEKGNGLGEGSTGASSAVCRTKYTRDEMVMLARDGIAAYRNWIDFVELSDPVATYRRDGVLWLGGGNGTAHEDVARLTRLGVAAEVLSDQDLTDRFPAVNPCPIPPDLVTGEPHACTAGGSHLFEIDGGYIEPTDVLDDLLRAVRSRGVEVRFRAEVAGVLTTGGSVSGVTTANGETVACGTLVTAAGPWCNRLFEFAGLSSPWPLVPTRIQIVQIDRPDSVTGHVPVCADPGGGIYFRSHNRGRQIVVGSVLEEDEREAVDPDAFDRDVDDDFARLKLHALQHRLPGLDMLRGVRGYSGLYTMNQVDVHPVVGETELAGLYVANGFSGHGFKIAPAVGSLLAIAITGLRLAGDTDVDREFLAFSRHPIAITSRSVLA